jgi:formylglycine-generating enzyme required for sulfatase activity
VFASLARLKIEELKPVQQASRAKPPKVTPKPVPVTPAVGVYPKQADSFKDCPACPEMVKIPTGKFRMGHIRDVGAVYTKPARPVREISIEFPFAMSRYEVTFDEYDRFTDATGRPRLADKGWGRGRHPALRMPRADAVAYAKWLSEKTGKYYRLPTEAEWEYAARGGKETNFWWGDAADPNRANFGAGVTGWLPAPYVRDDDKFPNTSPVGAFPPNPFGLYDMHGNLWEFVEDCYHDSYEGAPDDSSARLDAPKSELDDEDDPPRACEFSILRGGSAGYVPSYGMSATRVELNWAAAGFLHFGIRLARDLD